LYKLITFPYKFSSLGIYIQLTAEYDNLVLDHSNQHFRLWKEAGKEVEGKALRLFIIQIS
jgi:hypothetical protein